MAETPNPDTGTGLTVEQFIAMVKDPSKIDELKQILAKMDPKALADLKAKIAPLLTNPAQPSGTVPVGAAQPSGTVPVGARISTAKGSFLRTTQGWVNADTNQPAQGALPIYLTKQYQAAMAKRGLTESSKPYHIRIRSVTK